ncbi:hypothetical protein [Legionella waltersii]|uniref:Coiled-coil protein n=1 Tax=Legionella waltersii TaxID=66969 RepID=A0A0W1AIZ0_9GAMM|nr:hypothetical protein [Legionella waltersii]KTD81338.1 coiled-coil protein [Legionella waltersii]SNV02796.1 coiled-coil protein [Legionella waltersii]
MEAERKERILKRYLKEKSLNPDSVNLTEIELAPYSDLDKLLEYIDEQNSGLFDFSKIESDDSQWQQLTNILSYSATFTPGSPPILNSINEQSALFGLKYWKNAREISKLPKDNYYTRPVVKQLEEDVELRSLINKSRSKLYQLLQSLSDAGSLSPLDNGQVDAQINSLTKSMDSLEENSLLKAKLQSQLSLLIDIKKLNHLERLRIPQDQGPVIDCCTIIDSVGGVTEKISLMKLNHVKERLEKLCSQEPFSLELYTSNREHYSLYPEGIIKLPKRGNIKEVQREAIALNISRILGIDTSTSVTVSYHNHPALFVPFDTIELLHEFTLGKKIAANLGLFGQTYTHYSTIKPIGEGIQADTFIDDFGHVLGLIYLCSDTDAIGGYCQNKALKNSRRIFVFDQSVMDVDKFILDSSLNLQPDQFIMKHTRHGQGRNRTLIEDSSMITKFASLMQLKELGDKIIQYVNYLAWHHQNRIEVIVQQLQSFVEKNQRALLWQELNDLQALEQDAELLKSTLAHRIAKIDAVLPKTSGSINPLDIQQALIFEKLVNNPVLFTDDARPYKNPWTTRHVLKITTISELDDEHLQLSFNDKPSESMIGFIKRRGSLDSITMKSTKSVIISKSDLFRVTESSIHPEHNLAWSEDTNYLDLKDLDQIKLAYGEGNTGKILGIISDYQAKVSLESTTKAEKLECIKQTESSLKELILTAHDKGFGMHVLKKFYFDSHQQLQKMMSPHDLPEHLSEAFVAALKLDRVSEFNSVIAEGLAQNKITDEKLAAFLDSCIHRSKTASNYKEAQKESHALQTDALQVKIHLQQSMSASFIQTGTTSPTAQSTFEIRIIEDLEEDLTVDRADLATQLKEPVSPQNSMRNEESASEETRLKM